MSEPIKLKNLIYISFVLLFLYLGKALFIPLSFSLFIAFVLYPVCKWLEQKKIPLGISISLSLLLLFIFTFLFGLFIVKQFYLVKEQIPGVQEKIPQTLSSFYLLFSKFLGISPKMFQTWIKESISNSFNFLPLIRKTLELSIVSIVFIILIPIYTFLLLYYRKNYVTFLIYLFPGTDKDIILSILKDTVDTYFKFITGMLLVYLIVGLLNSIGLLLLGIPSPFFWGFMASILTIIPYVGIVMGTIVPISIAFVTHDSGWYPIGVVLIFTFVQILEAYLIFPLAVGNRLKLNPLIILLAVIAGGILWGVSGMILFIPALGILKLISERIPEMKPISILIGSS